MALTRKLTAAVGRELTPDSDVEGLSVALSGILLMLALHARAGAGATELQMMHRQASGAILKGSLPR